MPIACLRTIGDQGYPVVRGRLDARCALLELPDTRDERIADSRVPMCIMGVSLGGSCYRPRVTQAPDSTGSQCHEWIDPAMSIG
jgi:hypothetical protein